MTPGSLILLHSLRATAATWGDLPEMLRSYGLDVIAPDIREGEGARYVARASLVIAATAPQMPLVLVAYGSAGPLLPAVAAAQRAAHRRVGAYVFVDAELPMPRRAPARGHGHEHGAKEETEVPVPPDWPEAPCGYLGTSYEYALQLRQAELRGWPARTLEPQPARAGGTLEHSGGTTARGGVAQALSELIATL